MYDYFISAMTLPKAYHHALVALQSYGRLIDCADWNCNQKEMSLTMRVMEPLQEPMISRCSFTTPEDLQQYVFEICDGLLDFAVKAKKLPYTYHLRMIEPINQIRHVIDTLEKNPSSRRAVIDIRRPEDILSDDPPCLQHIQFMIRDNALNMSVLFRSNDAVKATFTNAFGLIMLQKRIADALGIDVGTYTHRVNSFHCYERDFDLLDAYVKRIKTGENTEMNYYGEWADMMCDSIVDIYAKVGCIK